MSSFNLADIKKFKNLELLARQVVEGFITGLHKSPFHGFSVEFAEHKTYNPGESTRHIDWKLYARSEKLFVKRFEEETNLRCQIIIDNSSSMYFPKDDNRLKKIEFATYCAAALTYLLKKQRDAVGLSLFSDKIESHYRAKSNSVHQKLLFAQLDKLLKSENQKLNKLSSTAECLHMLAENIHKRSLIILFSDMLVNSENPDEVFSALKHLKHNKHEVILFHVYDKEKELKFDYKNRPLRFIDMETSKEIKLNPAQIKNQYQHALGEYFNQVKTKCLQYRIDFVEADVNEGFEKVLSSFLVKRARLF
ncbi:MAG: DUF58 domain-containing protein [Bacteroidota bacterium]